MSHRCTSETRQGKTLRDISETSEPARKSLNDCQRSAVEKHLTHGADDGEHFRAGAGGAGRASLS